MNNLAAKENLISYIILLNKRVNNLLDEQFRQTIAEQYNLFDRTSKNGRDLICFCEQLNLFARTIKTN